MNRQPPDFGAILDVLVKHDVQFVIVGGVSAVLQGAPVATFGLDIVHERGPANLARLVEALEELGAHYREHTRQVLKPKAAHLASPGHHLLMTSGGPLDLLGEVGDRRGFSQLLKQTTELGIGRGRRVRVLTLGALIDVKKRLGRDKDKAVLAVLQRTLEEKGGRAKT